MDWEGQTIGFPRVSATCDYIRPVTFEDLLDVAVILDRLGGKSVTFAFEFSLNGEPVARGKVTSVCCRVRGDSRLESMEIPASYRARLIGAV
jgi:acyl-CoA thioesterase FadM